MITKRIIPCLDVRDGRVVKGVNFVDLVDAGDPVAIAKAYDEAGADEIVFLDITASSDNRNTVVDMVRQVAANVFIPFTVGGGIRSVDDFKALLREGADKISVNSSAINRPELIKEAAEKFGLQILESHINESNQNSTRFAVFSRSEKAHLATDNHFIMLFTVNNAAGSLGKAISVIGEHGFNLKALKSRPTKELVWDYYFYAEGEGNIGSEQGKKMLSELAKCCSNLKILGSFEKEVKV